MKIPIPLLLILLNMQNILARPFGWPTDASHLMTSSFCEYRSGHLHAGLDIKTWNREGYAVFAVDSGMISRISVSPYGYGKALYLRLQDGKTVVYGHLSRFADPLENEVIRRQKINGKYALDLYLTPGEFPVKSGELIAYTGSTGVGVPHLHFEVRDPMDRPFNPLDLGYVIRDTQAPVIQAVAVSPMEWGSHVDGDFKPKILQVGIHGPISSGPVPVWGKIGISVQVYDQADGASNCFSAAVLRLFADDSLVFTTRYGCFEYLNSKYVDLDRDLRLMAQGEGLFQNLFLENSNPLDFYQPYHARAGTLAGGDAGDSSEILNPGSFLLDRGIHRIRVEAEDYWGNTGSALMIVDVKPLSEVMQSGINGLVAASSRPASELTRTWIRDFIRFGFRANRNLYENPELRIWLNGGFHAAVPLRQDSRGEYIGALPLTGSFHGRMVCEVTSVNPAVSLWKDTTEVFYVDRNGGRLVSSDRMFQCQVPFDAVHEPIWFQIGKEQNSCRDFPVYSVIPDGVFLKHPCRIQILVSSESGDMRGAGLYAAGKHRLYMPGYRDSSKMILIANTRNLSRFTVLRDTVPPVIYSVFPDSGTVVSRNHFHVRSRFSDNLSGIGNEDHYRLWIDGSPRILCYDPEENLAVVEYPDSLGAGEHSLELRVRDRAGNEASRIHSFSIIP